MLDVEEFSSLVCLQCGPFLNRNPSSLVPTVSLSGRRILVLPLVRILEIVDLEVTVSEEKLIVKLVGVAVCIYC